MLEAVRACFDQAQYRTHALEAMVERGISRAEIREALFSEGAEAIEEYPDDHYGACCLVLGWRSGTRPLHIVFGLTPPGWVITLWDPSLDPRQRWEADYRTRRPATGGQS